MPAVSPLPASTRPSGAGSKEPSRPSAGARGRRPRRPRPGGHRRQFVGALGSTLDVRRHQFIHIMWWRQVTLSAPRFQTSRDRAPDGTPVGARSPNQLFRKGKT
jgi:hypothetical protein